MVHNVEVEPTYKSIYFRGAENPYTFNINHGSGEFNITMNVTDIARFEHRGRELVIIPIRQGSLQITINDVLLPESKPVFAELLISDIWKLTLDTQGYLLEKGSSMNMSVKAFDNHGKEFEEDQYKKMKFEIQHVVTSAHKEGQGLQGKQLPGNPRSFTVTGL